MEKNLSRTRPVCFRPETGMYEQKAWRAGAYLCGIDEVGRGCLAGPVIAVAALLPLQTAHPLLVDSKILTETKRLIAYSWLKEHAVWGTGIISSGLIDELNIYQATQRAMKKAVYTLMSQLPSSHTIDSVVIDAMPLFLKGYEDIPIHSYPKGESWSSSIAAASIIAKVTRDELMTQIVGQFPAHGMELHKGYGTPIHQQALQASGITLIHRVTFLKSLLAQEDKTGQTTLF